jgi:glutathione S-transferase
MMIIASIRHMSSVAILTYLADKHKKHEWYPMDLQRRAHINEYAHWQHLNLRLTGSMLFQTKVRRSVSICHV